MADIFLSYAREDESRVQPLADVLAQHGWSVFWDRRIPGLIDLPSRHSAPPERCCGGAALFHDQNRDGERPPG
jgi:hypothetical protein